ncbi:hypothetical protein CHS0354_032443 [Potamilus streckersoni]|uniref:Uncharacterized protein n=1 Tax=Potamilus streckersoni TaxID=2493646 RepID=A0AAE0W0M0_9BIVA|nr:hypothetical protein CHS0354_032443 [Potamilus streckersoni]
MDMELTCNAETPPGYEMKYGIKNKTFETGDGKSDSVDETVPVAVIDPWALPELNVQFTQWSELTCFKKMKRLFLHYILKTVLLLAVLYLFICSLGFMGDAFKLLGGKTAGKAFQESNILSNPVAGLMIGVLATVLLQSSSTTTTIIVSMVAEEVLTVKLAIPIVMGANIGTSITNTIVSLGHIANKDEFRRAFAGATIHDMFNWLTVLVLLPLEVISGYLEWLSGVLVESLKLQADKEADKDFLQVIIGPFTKLIIQMDKHVIENIAKGKNEYLDQSILKTCCDKIKTYMNQTVLEMVNGTLVNSSKELQATCKKPCEYLFRSVAKVWSDSAIGAVLLVLALIIMCACLVAIVKLLHSLLKGQMAVTIRKFVNANFPGRVCGYFTGYLAIIIGAGFTVLIQSSSVFTSSLTPLVGMGVISLDRMYPLTLGSNIGTTATGILAAMAQDIDKVPHALQIAFCHLFFNISGILIFYPIPFFRPPIGAAKFLGTETAKYRWFSLVYLILMFFVIPAITFALSEVSWIALTAVLVPIAVVIFVLAVIKCIQTKKPGILPQKLQNWKWLPKPLRSLEPYDRIMMKATGNCICCRKCGYCKGIYVEEVPAKKHKLNQNVDSTDTIVTEF